MRNPCEYLLTLLDGRRLLKCGERLVVRGRHHLRRRPAEALMAAPEGARKRRNR